MAVSNRSADVIVLGLGAMGSAAAAALASRGVRVIGFDRFVPPHSHGSSHGLSRMYRQAYWEDPRYVPLLLRAFDLWQDMCKQSGQPIFHVTGGLAIGRSDSELVTRTIESAFRYRLPHHLLSAQELCSRFPVLTGRVEAEPETVGVLESNAGYVLPEAAIRFQLQEAARCGAALQTGEEVQRWSSTTTSVMVQTSAGTYTAAHLVITAGPWAAAMLRELALPLRVTRQVLYWFEPSARPADFAEGALPVYLFDAPHHVPMVYGFPETSPGEGVKVALHGSSEVTTPETVRREVTAEDEAEMRERLRSTLPSLASGRLLHAETCLYTMTPDEHFIIDNHPEHANVSLAAGFSGHGFKFTPIVGEILADLATAGTTGWDTDLFRIFRLH